MSRKFGPGLQISRIFFKYSNYVNFYEHFDFSLVVGNIYISWTAIS